MFDIDTKTAAGEGRLNHRHCLSMAVRDAADNARGPDRLSMEAGCRGRGIQTQSAAGFNRARATRKIFELPAWYSGRKSWWQLDAGCLQHRFAHGLVTGSDPQHAGSKSW